MSGSCLVCVECGREQHPEEQGWRSHVTTDEEEPAEVIIYCWGLRRA